MGVFANQISDLPLYQELDRAAGRDSIDATEVVRLKGLVAEVADMAGPALAQIPVTFRQYTVHDIRHCRNVIALMGNILPADTREKLNALEIAFLLLSALLHDVGMVVDDREKSETLLSDSFRRFKEEGHADRSKAIEEASSTGNEPRAQAIEDALLAEYYRRLHPERVRQFLDRHLPRRLQYQEVDFADDLARLCESHAWGVEESNDARNPEKAVARLDDNVRLSDVRVNLQYLACILRIADILDFDRSRTPLAVFQHLDFTEDRSWEEWNKHLQVKGREITEKQVAFDIPCTHPVFYVAVHEFLGWIDEELRQCRYLVENKPQPTAERYKLFLPQVVDRHKVRMADPSYVAGAFRFQLEYENILTLLMDRSLYPDPSLFLRELLQNALDACRRKEAAMELAGLKKLYKPKIVVWDRSDDPNDPRIVFQDNGIGMSLRIVEQYFLRIGRSYYRSPEFDAERRRLQEVGKELDACSQFGIGILSCFLVGDRFEAETFQEGYDPLHIWIEGRTKYFMIRRSRAEASPYGKPVSDEEDGPPKRNGTRVTVHLRREVQLDVWKTLDDFAANTDYPIAVHRAGTAKPKTIPALRWEQKIRPEKFRFTSHAAELPVVLIGHPGLDIALVPSFIPFHHWEFSNHLRGQSWFWLLRGDAGPSVTAGFLAVGESLKLFGYPALVAKIDREHELDNRLRQLEGKRALAYSERTKELNRRAEKCLKDDEIEPDYLVEEWLSLDEKDRSLVEELVLARHAVLRRSRKQELWVQNVNAVESLLAGSHEWVEEPIIFGSNADISGYIKDEQLALHSILLPAGIVRWSPSEGSGRSIRLLPIFGGLWIDVRGMRAPQPAAHRLYVPDEEADDLRQRYLRAALRHGIDLVGRQDDRPEWRRWFGELAAGSTSRGINQELWKRTDAEYLADRCRLAVSIDGETKYRSRAELVAQGHGALPMLRATEASEARVSLVWEDPVNRTLVDWKARVSKPMISLNEVPFQVLSTE